MCVCVSVCVCVTVCVCVRVCVCVCVREKASFTYLCILQPLKLIQQLTAEHHIEVLPDTITHLCSLTTPMATQWQDEALHSTTVFSRVSTNGCLKLTAKKQGWALTQTCHLYMNHRIIKKVGGRLHGDGCLFERIRYMNM